MIDGINLRAKAKRCTHRRCEVLTQCQFPKRGVGGGGISLIKGGTDGCTASAKSRPGKIAQFLDKVLMNFKLQESQNFSTNDVIHRNR